VTSGTFKEGSSPSARCRFNQDRVPALTQKITLIIPLRLTAGTYEGELRLKRLCATVPRDLYDILISDYGTEDRHAGPVRALAAEGVEVVRHPAPGKLFSIGHARDFGVQMARGKVVMFNDVDFLGTPDMYRRIHAEVVRRNIAANLFDFFCVPVLFLTEPGTRVWFERTGQDQPFLERDDIDCLEQAAADIQFTAFGSSAMVVNRHHYLSLGGHDPNFQGHGAEDYDLLNRLAALAPKGPRPNDYFTDFKDNGVRNYWGFRPFFALYGLDVFLRGLHLVHLWHPRRQEKGYFRSQPNFRHLRKVMLGFDRRGRMPPPLGDLRREGRWLVLYRTAKDLALIRQFLPFARHHRLVALRALPASYGLARLLDMAADDLILIAPGVRGDRGEFAAEPLLAKMPIIELAADRKPEMYRIAGWHGGPTVGQTLAQAQALRPGRGRAPFFFWPHVELGSGMVVDSGEIPPPEPATSALFSTFGGETMLDRTLHPRPEKKRKSTLWVKLKRRLTGY
jgi:hypothetical protein